MAIAGTPSLLPELDLEFLNEKGFDCEVTQVGAEVRVVINGFPFPHQYTPRTARLMLRLPAGFPNANPDMFWRIITTPVLETGSGGHATTILGGRGRTTSAPKLRPSGESWRQVASAVFALADGIPVRDFDAPSL